LVELDVNLPVELVVVPDAPSLPAVLGLGQFLPEPPVNLGLKLDARLDSRSQGFVNRAVMANRPADVEVVPFPAVDGVVNQPAARLREATCGFSGPRSEQGSVYRCSFPVNRYPISICPGDFFRGLGWVGRG
jgi:hypothetical protein